MKQFLDWITPTKIASLTAIFYLLLTLLMLQRAPAIYPQLQSFSDRFFLFVHPGSFWDRRANRPFDTEYIGYDGQFFYDLASNPLQPLTTLDKPAYRTARILYPLLVSGLAGGQPRMMPGMLLLVNFIAIIAATFIFAHILRQLKRPMVWACGYALWPGTICAFLYDLSEPLCFVLVLAALWLHFCRPCAVWRVGSLLLLASLTKELALLFGVGWLLYYLARREWANLGKLATSWLLPFVVWQEFLCMRFGKDGLSAGEPFQWFPFGGFFNALNLYHPPWLEWLAILLATTLPTIWVILLLFKLLKSDKGATWLAKICRTNPLFFMVACQLAFLIFLPTATYVYLLDHARNATGLIILCYLFPAAAFKPLRLYLMFLSLLLTTVVIITFANSGNAFLNHFLN